MKTRPGVSCVQSGCVFLVSVSRAEGTYISHGGHSSWTKDVDAVDLIRHVCLGTSMDGLL